MANVTAFPVMNDMSSIRRDFVIKLRIVNDNGLFRIHRVLPSYIQEEDGSISFQSLVHAAIQLRFPRTQLTSDECHVTFKYYDIENNCKTISSTTELFNTIDQFQKSERVLRITADVKKKIKVLQIDQNSSNTQIMSTLSEEGLTTESEKRQYTNTMEQTGQKAPNAFFEAFASLFVNDAHNSKIKKSNERPFLHCRHTCDECECTPIVGPRYHAEPDVDLCIECYKNYKGNEFDFVLEEQERDRPYQDLWHEKWERMNSPKNNNGLLFWWNQGSRSKINEKDILRQKLNKVMTQYENESQIIDDYSIPRKGKMKSAIAA